MNQISDELLVELTNKTKEIITKHHPDIGPDGIAGMLTVTAAMHSYKAFTGRDDSDMSEDEVLKSLSELYYQQLLEIQKFFKDNQA